MGRRGARFGRGERIQVIRGEIIAAGVCIKCGKNKPDEGRLMCRAENTSCKQDATLEVKK